MAIRVPNLGTGSGNIGDGDNELKIRSDYNHNFTDRSNAASRNVGVTPGDLLEMTTCYGVGSFGLGGKAMPIEGSTDYNDILTTGYYTVSSAAPINAPRGGITGVMSVIKRNWSSGSSVVQTVMGNAAGETYVRTGTGGSDTSPDSWTPWQRVIINGNNDIYSGTTASGANVVVDSSGKLMRSSSSESYKNIIAELELDDAAYANAMQLAPIIYRSKSEADNPDYHYYSFSAEQLGAHDPAFTLWRDTETVTDDEGNVTEQPLDERVAEGINLNAIVAFLHATNIKQGKLIADLEQRLSALEALPEV